ncbi:hypothetical protein KMP13_09325 [Epibacterium ulvae]|uniref:DUF6538 domain-containing protein n=1 Tax=Epibacterium ulvae TaxID=1156985 RepID=UPI001BFCBEE8|nr:DUF6538 domain-containing protein [Epibacterium ulvae]MBT8154091.1 hypothetical protein [Epibacterium ulvae]
MGLTLDRGRYYFVLNVPKDLLGKVRGKSGQPVRQVRQALRTADLTVAKRKAFELEEIKRAEWQLLALGNEALAHQKFEAAKRTAESRGFDYIPSDVLLKGSFQENLPRLLTAAGTDKNPTTPEVAEAILGGVKPVYPPLDTVLEEFIDLTRTKHLSYPPKIGH